MCPQEGKKRRKELYKEKNIIEQQTYKYSEGNRRQEQGEVGGYKEEIYVLNSKTYQKTK